MPLNDQPIFPIRRLANREPHITASGGFTLLEVLVAVVVISLGLLGLAGVQVVSLNNNQTAYYRALATQQAYDMADRMRANLAGVTAGNYDSLTATNPADPGCFPAGCVTVTEISDTDYFQWLANTAAMLPGGAGTVRCCTEGTVAAGDCVCNTATSNRKYEIAVTWTERAATTGVNNATQSFITRFAP